jgi:hypothetical protein
MRRREFYYAWCNTTEVDYVCERCLTIVLNPQAGCQHCHETEEKARARLAEFLAKRKVEVAS